MNRLKQKFVDPLHMGQRHTFTVLTSGCNLPPRGVILEGHS